MEFLEDLTLPKDNLFKDQRFQIKGKIRIFSELLWMQPIISIRHTLVEEIVADTSLGVQL